MAKDLGPLPPTPYRKWLDKVGEADPQSSWNAAKNKAIDLAAAWFENIVDEELGPDTKYILRDYMLRLMHQLEKEL